MRTLLIFILSVLSCSAQMPFICGMMAQQPPPVSSAFVLTNSPSSEGANLISWWRGDFRATNGGNTYVLSDIGGAHAYDLTNKSAASFWPVPTTTNTLLFTATDPTYLKTTLYSASQPHEIWIVAKIYGTNGAGNDSYFFDSTDGTARERAKIPNAADRITWSAGNDSYFSYYSDATNKWIAYCFSFAGTKSAMFTNNVNSGGVLNAGTANQTGFTLGTRQDVLNIGTWASHFELAEMFTYSATNSVTSRSNIYWYLKNVSTVCTNLGMP